MCDPVLGDNGQLYVPQTLIPIYQNEILPLCDICTPNQFEAETLTGLKIKSEEDAWKAIDWFHEKGVKTVVLSSTNVGADDELTGYLSRKDGTFTFLSTKKIFNSNSLFDISGNQISKHSISIPVIGNGIQFTGVGDLFAAIFLAHSTTKTNLSEALEYTIATIQAVLINTLKSIPIGNFKRLLITN